MKKIKVGKTLWEMFNPRLKRIILYNGEGKADIYLIDPKKEIDKKRKRKAFTIDKETYIYDESKMFKIGKITYLQYIKGCALPFSITHGDEAIPDFADAKKLHTVLDMHFLESILSNPSEKLYTLFIVISLIAGIFIGHILG